MIGLVIVSHSAKLAEGVCELIGQVAKGKLKVAAAGGTADPTGPPASHILSPGSVSAVK